MSWIRIDTSFTSNKKTIRLISKVGADGVVALLNLWSYAANNQKDGDFTGYGDLEFDMILKCSKQCSSNAQAMLQAFQECGFMDGMVLHDWSQYNGALQANSLKAKNAADKRWEEHRKEHTNVRTPSICSSNAPSMTNQHAGFDEFWAAYPRRVGRGKAEESWRKMKPPLDVCIKTLTWQKKSTDWNKENGKFIPHPTTWLNQKRWMDEPVKTEQSVMFNPLR